MQIPLVDLSVQSEIVRDEVDRAIVEIIDSSAYIMGPHVARFEHQFAEYIGVKHAIGVGNGTDALHLALRACGIGPGDEVITAANTFMATVEAIGAVGATPVLVDADPASYTIDPEKIESQVTSRTRAIIPVHLYGQPANMTAIEEIAARHGLRVIEDACQSHGARYGERRTGAIGDIGCFSCYPGKNLGAYGDAGVVVTNDDTLAERVRLLANHGSRVRYHHEIEGWNSRLDTIQAVVLNVKLPHLDAWNQLRRQHAERYSTLLEGSGVKTPTIQNGDHVWHLYVIETDDR
ncbi:MAG TPA: DegT/DnrJ/EryC1/StrS family aminotransferase, partial [Thermomicrobiales bacterium]|nr:DegT/DnrJ/EryC1/StrS family aminotransferase [Thermomicrobiales bacterium]